MTLIIIILFLHSAADFILRGSNLKKIIYSKLYENMAEFGIYIVFFACLSPFLLDLSFVEAIVFSLINAFAHVCINLICNKLKKQNTSGNDTKYYTAISFDHFMHIIILVVTYIYLCPDKISNFIL
jgi:hypothetical protein